MSVLKENLKVLNGAQIVVETLKVNGVECIFGYPGGVVLNVYDELFKQNDIKHYLVRHEQAAVHAAEGYARVSNKCGCVLVTSGPGAANIVSGIANAYMDGYPLVVITGQVKQENLGKNSFGEINILDITKSCTKKNFQVSKVSDLEKTLNDAFFIANEGKKGPVVVSVTKNVFIENSEFKGENEYKQKPNFNSVDIASALKMICESQRPVIVSGGGVVHSDASSELSEFARLLKIPVVNTLMGVGTYPKEDERHLGMIGLFGNPSANQLLRESDLIFAVGARFNNRVRCCFKNDELSRKLIHLDINPDEISKNVPASFALAGDAKQILQKMIAESKSSKLPIVSNLLWQERIKELKSEVPKYIKKSNNLHSFEVMEIINEFIKPLNPIITTEVGQHQIWAARLLDVNNPRNFITSGGLGTMGFGFPASIGASIAGGNSPLICVTGDGSLQMNIQELMTFAEYNIPVKIMIMNNGYLGMVRQLQEKVCENRYSETKISNPDFVKLAKAYGIKGLRVEKKEDIISALQEAFSHSAPVLIDFVVEPFEVL